MTTRTEWLAARQQVITATDLPAILGISKFASALDIWLSKTEGLPVQREPTEAMVAGLRLERPILEWYADDQQVVLHYPEPFTLTKSPTFDFLGATLDSLRVEDGNPVDAKNLRYQSAEFGEPMTDEMPLYYAAQLVMQMHCVGAQFADLAVLFSGQDLRVYRLHRDTQLEQDLLERAVDFWQNHVVPRVPPPIDGSASWSKYLSQRIRQESEMVIPATPELHMVAVDLARLEAVEDTLRANIVLHQNQLKAAIGEARGVSGHDWRALWSTVKPTIGVDWEAVAKGLAELVARGAACIGEDEKHMAAEILANEASTHQIVTRNGYRRFAFTFSSKA